MQTQTLNKLGISYFTKSKQVFAGFLKTNAFQK